MSSTAAAILFILLLILANGLFALSEMAIVSARKARLQHWAERGDARARAALELAGAPNRFLSTVQIGITLVGILAGAAGGTTLAAKLEAPLSRIPALSPYSAAVSLGIVVLGITFLSLLLGELVPKRLALHHPERIACAVAIPMRVLSRIALPAVHLLSVTTDGMLRVLGIRPSVEPPITDEEIKILIEQGTEAGVFEEAEHGMVAGVFRLSDRRARALMTPRTEIVWLDLDDPTAEIRRKLTASAHSRLPLCEGNLDNVQGIVQAKDVLACGLAGEPIDWKALAQRPLFVPESMGALKLLETFKQTGRHLALVMDEYGGTQGLVTPSDILEAIVGEMPVVGEPVEPQAVQREDGSWLLDGMMAADEFNELFHVSELPEEESGEYETLGGFVMMYLGRIPAAGDHFEWGGLRFEVLDMDGHRVDKVLVAPAVRHPEEVPNGA